MGNNIRTKQALVITAIVLLVGFLFTREIKGLVVPKKEETAQMPTQTTETASLEEVSATAKNLVSVAFAKDITALENTYKSATGSDKIANAKQLAQNGTMWSRLHLAPCI